MHEESDFLDLDLFIDKTKNNTRNWLIKKDSCFIEKKEVLNRVLFSLYFERKNFQILRIDDHINALIKNGEFEKTFSINIILFAAKLALNKEPPIEATQNSTEQKVLDFYEKNRLNDKIISLETDFSSGSESNESDNSEEDQQKRHPGL